MMPPRARDAADGIGEKRSTVRATPLRIGWRKMLANVAVADCAKQGVGQGMQPDVGVRVAKEGPRMRHVRCRRCEAVRISPGSKRCTSNPVPVRGRNGRRLCANVQSSIVVILKLPAPAPAPGIVSDAERGDQRRVVGNDRFGPPGLVSAFKQVITKKPAASAPPTGRHDRHMRHPVRRSVSPTGTASVAASPSPMAPSSAAISSGSTKGRAASWINTMSSI